MTTVVSFTDFRENLSKYLAFIASGNKVEINDAKKDKKLVTLIAEKEEKIDWDSYMKFIKTLAGSGLLASREDELARKKFKDDINKGFAKARNF
jgi:antitoxin (DNA-binding transcriptional repressor) of toxin-antitoxin stability system